MLAVHGADEFFDRLQNKDLQLQRELNDAAGSLVANLRTKAQTIANDKSIAKNMTWKLRHSVRKSIANVVDNEQVAIFNRQCDQLWGDEVAAATTACKNIIVRGQETYVDQRHLTITHGEHFNSNNKILVLVSAMIDRDAYQRQGYRIVASNNEISGLAYQHQDSFWRYMSANADFYRQVIAKLQWTLYLLMLLLLINVGLLNHKFNKRVQAAFKYLQNWSSSSPASTDKQLRGITANLTSEIATHVQRATQIEKQLQEQSKRLNEALRRDKMIQAQLERQTFLIAALQQVKDLNAYFLSSNRTSQNLAQNLHRSMTSLQQEELDEMFAICQKWEHEFSQRHFVNFLGSYHNSDQDKLLTHLQQDLFQLFAVTRSLASAWQDIVRLTKQIDNCAQELDKPLLRWEQVLANNQLGIDTPRA
ncbi:MAG: hypothetical protein OYH77_06525 [Pseudomonadota bacterium]|nr:hypothetical protein [Pseudomonadota bacterium]